MTIEFSVENPDDEAVMRRLADQFDTTVGEMVSRAVALYELWASLEADAHLGIIHANGTIERLTFAWKGYHPDLDHRDDVELADQQMATARVFVVRKAKRVPWWVRIVIRNNR